MAAATVIDILEWTWSEFATHYEFGDTNGLAKRMQAGGLDVTDDKVGAALQSGLAGDVDINNGCKLRVGRFGWRWERAR